MLVKSDLISKLPIKSEVSKSQTYFTNEKESFLGYTLFVSGLNKWSQNGASLYLGVPITDKIGQNDGVPSSNSVMPFVFCQAHAKLLI